MRPFLAFLLGWILATACLYSIARQAVLDARAMEAAMWDQLHACDAMAKASDSFMQEVRK